jgi:hypothetical protein
VPTLTLNLADQATSINSGDLADVHALQASAFTLASDVFTAVVLGEPISSLSGDFLKGDLNAGSNQQWKQTIDSSTSITFGVNPSIKCSVIVRKAGTVFPSSLPAVSSDPTTTKTITVPDGKAYISIVLSVSLQVTANGKFTNGTLGVSAGIDAQDTFGLANHFLFDQSKPIRDAIVDAFSRFVLPFGPDINDLNDLQPGDIVESEFVGSLALSASLTEGFNGVLFGAFGSGGLSLSGKSPLGSVLASAKPTFNLGLSFEVDYTHTDAFRMIIHAQQSEIELLYFKRKTDDLKTTIDASATLSPGVSVDFTGQIPSLINSSAQKLVAGADPAVAQAFTNGVSQLVSAATEPLTDAANDLNSVVPNLLKKLPSLTVDASVTFETVTQNTIFGVFDFSPLPANAAAWKLAMAGDLQSALHLPGIQLGAGSYIENSLTKSTTLKFAFFGLNAQTVEQYLNDVTLTYAGNGQFQYRLKTGIAASSNIFGHQKEADFYFLVAANLVQDGAVNNEDVTLNIVRKDQNASDRSFSLGKTISLILPSNGPAIALSLAVATRTNPKVPVTLTAQFAASAFSKIRATPFIGGKPQPLAAQVDDKVNFGLYAQAVDDVASSSDHFPDVVNDYANVWARVNENLIGQPGGPPDRTQTGAVGNTAQAFDGLDQFAFVSDGQLEIFLNFLEDARQFMNLCADLQQLATLISDPDTSEQLTDLVNLVTQIGKSGAGSFPLDFLNAILLALVRRMGAAPTNISAPIGSDGKTFDVTVSYS